MSDNNLICSFGWGRSELVEKSFTSLLENKRPQDKLLIIDQEMKNWSIYEKRKDAIDFLIFLKYNYAIGPSWELVKSIVEYKSRICKSVLKKRKQSDMPCSGYLEKDWQPDFINIIESDAIGNIGWIDDVIKIYKCKEPIGIATGYDAPEHKVIRYTDNIKIKEITPGVQMMMKTDHFFKIMEKTGVLPMRGHDWIISAANKNLGMVIGVVNHITHIG